MRTHFLVSVTLLPGSAYRGCAPGPSAKDADVASALQPRGGRCAGPRARHLGLSRPASLDSAAHAPTGPLRTALGPAGPGSLRGLRGESVSGPSPSSTLLPSRDLCCPHRVSLALASCLLPASYNNDLWDCTGQTRVIASSHLESLNLITSAKSHFSCKGPCFAGSRDWGVAIFKGSAFCLSRRHTFLDSTLSPELAALSLHLPPLTV